MNFASLKLELCRLGVQLDVDRDRLRVRDPKRVISTALVVAIRIHRATFLCELRQREEWLRVIEGDYSNEELEAMLARHRLERKRVGEQRDHHLPMFGSPSQRGVRLDVGEIGSGCPLSYERRRRGK